MPIRHYLLIALAFAILTLSTPPGHSQIPQSYDFYSHGPYKGGVPRPSAILGYEAGATHTTFRDMERVLFAIAGAAKDRVRVIEYGASNERRPLRLAIISSPENLAKLDETRSRIGKLADPRTLANEAEGARIVQSTPCITWINECIHGDETASFEAGMWTLYTLAASESPEVKQALKESVIILNPVFNPDGHERFVVYSNSISVGSPERAALEGRTPWMSVGRHNHYRFDMNRDKIAQSQAETQQESAVYLKWHPQVFVDQHGQVENYFFPPVAQAINRQTGRERVNRWNDLFGRANAAAFDSRGWQYVNREQFDLFAPVYLDIWATLQGAIGMTYETDGGRRLASRRQDQTIITLRDGIAHHVESALATIYAAAKNREALLKDFLAFHRDAISAGQTDRMKRIVILPGSDSGRAAELAAILKRVGVEVKETTAPFESQSAHSYLNSGSSSSSDTTAKVSIPQGALIVEMAQPAGRIARAFLEPDADFEPEFVKEQLARKEANEQKNENASKDEYGFYDITAWSLPLAYNLRAYWLEDTPPVQVRNLEADNKGNVSLSGKSGGITGPKDAVAYIWRYDTDSAVMAVRLLQEDCHLGVITRPVKVAGTEWPRGTLVAHVARNPKNVRERIESLAKELKVEVTALSTTYGEGDIGGLGSGYISPVQRPSIAVVGGDGVGIEAFGAVWHILEKQVGVKFTSISMDSLRSADLSNFNAIVLPNGSGYRSLGKADNLREWMSRGGALVGLGGGGTWFADKDVAITSAVPVGRDDKPEKPDEKPTVPAPKPEDKKDKKPIDLPGAFFKAKVDTKHFLGYGYSDEDIAVPLSGSTFLKPSLKGENVVTFPSNNLRISGFVWPGNTEKFLANTSYVIDEPIGNGHAILFLADPTFRSYWAGMRKMFLSAILFAPGRAPSFPAGTQN